MPNPKPNLKPKPKPVIGRAKLDRMPAMGQPFMRFFHAPVLRKKTLVVLERLEMAPDPTQHRMALALMWS